MAIHQQDTGEKKPSEKLQEENVALRNEKDELKQKLENQSKENKDLLDAVLDLQDYKKFLTRKNSFSEAARCKAQEEIDDLMARNTALQEKEKRMKLERKHHNEEVAGLQLLLDRKQREVENLRKEVCHLQYKVEDAQKALREKDDVIQKLTRVESLVKIKEEEVRYLTHLVAELQENETVLKDKNKKIRDQLRQVASLRRKLHEDNSGMKTAMQDLQCQVENGQKIITQQSMENACNQKIREKRYQIICAFSVKFRGETSRHPWRTIAGEPRAHGCHEELGF
ncbi:trichohyalin-like [Cynoglossus semilaevis]|uniref:trichohyalin-like n=1 Tax=Cynoglossus semilaevis TaxID=244447 RepID=UPI0004967CA6|nr:trichohyalin-like [Cynoglossus semilaevis]XP_008334734.1 trichohyalin-like [Cynoglossus semilaevis]